MTLPKFRLGKHPKRTDSRTLQLRSYLTAELPPVPATVTYEQAVKTWPMMANDIHSDCTIAAAGHMIEDWTANTESAPVILLDPAILAAYDAVNGGVDKGADILTVLKYWENTGIGGHQITAFSEISTGDLLETQQSVALFAAAYIGLALPNFAVNPPDGNFLNVPWTIPSSGVRANPPNYNNGHCVPIVGYDAQNLWVVTWGALKSMSPDFFAAYCDEAYAVLSTDWLKGGVTPLGLNLQQLQADLAAIHGNA